ncbi:MAG: lipase family protein [Chloroflexota bacterium]
MIPEPRGDFYAVPEPLPPGEPGDVIWAQPIAAPRDAVAWRVLYHSRSVQGADIAVSGLVVAPDGPPPSEGFPVVAVAHGTTGLADECAPSKEAVPLRRGQARTGSLSLPPLWTLGYVVAATDYEGLGTPGRHPYLVGVSEGRGVLDSIRAARALPGARASSQAVVVGGSQGGHAALFAGEIAAEYAPDVALAGIVALAPGAELAHAALLLSSEPSAVGFAVAIGAGFAAAYPEADLERVLTPYARRLLSVVDRGCIDDVLSTFAKPVDQVLRLEEIVKPPWPALLEENTPGRVATPVPIFVGQGGADPLVVPELTDALVARLCAIGNDVTYRRYAGAGHVDIVSAAATDVEAWIRARFEGRAEGPSTVAGTSPCPD